MTVTISDDVITSSPPSACGFAAHSARTNLPAGIDTASLDDILSLPGQDRIAKHTHKDVLRLSGAVTLSSTPLHFGDVHYVKRQWAWDRRFPRWSDWRDGVSRMPDPVREWHGLQTLRSLELLVPTPLQLLRDGHLDSARSALLMSAVPVERSLADWLQSGDVARLDPFDRRRLIVAITGIAERIHGCGLRWRSMKARHLYPEHTPAGNWHVWLIDCEGGRHRATRRQQRRDRLLLLQSLRAAGADGAFVSSAESALLVRPLRRTSRSHAASRLFPSLAFAPADGR